VCIGGYNVYTKCAGLLSFLFILFILFFIVAAVVNSTSLNAPIQGTTLLLVKKQHVFLKQF